jgi:16S rRNA (cytidine1402-2'-O)-methyltransferase
LTGHPPLKAGLYLVATPIGTAGDITLRALDILARADVLAAEDTRQLRRLMDIHGIKAHGRMILPYHDHNGAAQRPKLVALVQEGRVVACVSDAGTPLIADPGYKLARAMIDAGLPVTAAPGASALLAALSLAGLPTDRFLFAGFLPPRALARRRELAGLAGVAATLVFFESPRRLAGTLSDMATVLGQREAAVCRELTKKFEEVRRGTLESLALEFAGADVKGEIVVVVGPGLPVAAQGEDVEKMLREALKVLSVKDAVRKVAQDSGASHKVVYGMALELSGARKAKDGQ